MQALIDFDGWRKWKDFAAAQPDATDSTSRASTSYSSYAAKPKIASHSPTSASNQAAANGIAAAPRPSDEDSKKARRRSVGIVRVPDRKSTRLNSSHWE